MKNSWITSIIIVSLMVSSNISLARETACGYDDKLVTVEHALISLSTDALFDHDKSELKATGRTQLDGVMSRIKDAQLKGKIMVEGHTCTNGPEDYNQALSEKRAQSVANYLIQNGLSSEHMVVEGKGETSPITTNESAEGRAKNRRVEVRVRVQVKAE